MASKKLKAEVSNGDKELKEFFDRGESMSDKLSHKLLLAADASRKSKSSVKKFFYLGELQGIYAAIELLVGRKEADEALRQTGIVMDMSDSATRARRNKKKVARKPIGDIW